MASIFTRDGWPRGSSGPVERLLRTGDPGFRPVSDQRVPQWTVDDRARARVFENASQAYAEAFTVVTRGHPVWVVDPTGRRVLLVEPGNHEAVFVGQCF